MTMPRPGGADAPEREHVSMKRKWRSLSMALVLAIIVFVPVGVNPPRVEAAWNNVIMAGRVLRSVNPDTSGCRATAYGRVDSNLVLFVANHCKDFGELSGNDMPYGPAYTDLWVQIGWWGYGTTKACNCPLSWEDNDLTYITLDVNSVWYPSSGRNRIYAGDADNSGTVNSNDYWYMTSQPGVYDGCAGFPAGGAYPDTSYRMWQYTMSTSTDYDVGSVTGLTNSGDGCQVFTKFGEHYGQCCDSATPIIRYSDQTTLNGLVTGFNDQIGTVSEGTKPATGTNGNRALYFNPFYEGLQNLDAYWDTHGNHTGAKLCITSSCPV